MTRLCAGWLALVLAAACSPVSDFSNVPDAAIDAPATTPPMIVSSVPENMQAQVSVLTPISLFFDRRLDPASVTPMTVRLRYTYGYAWFYQYAKVSYDDAARKVSVVPNVPMYWSYRYEVRVDGVTDLAGNTLNDGSITFQPYVNELTRAAYYNSSGVISQVYRYEHDANGRSQKTVRYTGAGVDTLWFTADDVVACCPYGNVYAADGRILEYRSYGAGPDTKPNTADDVLSSLSKLEYDATGLLKYEVSYLVGPDGVLGTSDDTIERYTAYEHDENGFQTSYAFYVHPGTDNTWKTPDDRTSSTTDGWGEYTNDAFGNPTRQVYRYVGADLMPRTADDVLASRYEQEFDSYGYQTRGIGYSGPGPDMMWLTADDEVGSWIEFERDADGLNAGYRAHNGVGPDGMWFTADDDTYTYQRITNGPTRQPTEYRSYNNPGPDMMWETADDPVSSYQTLAYDANGNRIDRKIFFAGPDGVFKTADDRVAYDGDLELAK